MESWVPWDLHKILLGKVEVLEEKVVEQWTYALVIEVGFELLA